MKKKKIVGITLGLLVCCSTLGTPSGFAAETTATTPRSSRISTDTTQEKILKKLVKLKMPSLKQKRRRLKMWKLMRQTFQIAHLELSSLDLIQTMTKL